MPPAEKDKLKNLQERIELAREGGKNVKTDPAKSHKGINYVWRMVLELVIGMVLGLTIGFALDQVFKTKPFFLVIMSLFGFGAGIRTMIRTAEEYSKDEGNKGK